MRLVFALFALFALPTLAAAESIPTTAILDGSDIPADVVHVASYISQGYELSTPGGFDVVRAGDPDYLGATALRIAGRHEGVTLRRVDGGHFRLKSIAMGTFGAASPVGVDVAGCQLPRLVGARGLPLLDGSLTTFDLRDFGFGFINEAGWVGINGDFGSLGSNVNTQWTDIVVAGPLVPEPSSWILAGLGLGAVVLVSRFRRP